MQLSFFSYLINLIYFFLLYALTYTFIIRIYVF